MKHYVLTYMLATLCCCAFGNDFEFPRSKPPYAIVQNINSDTVKSNFLRRGLKPTTFAIKGGIQLVNMNFNEGHSGVAHSLEAIWKSGVLLGGLVRFQLSNKSYMSQEYLISRVRGRYRPYETDYVLDYIALPVLVHFEVRPKIKLATGPQFELLLQGKEISNGKAAKITQLTEERSIGVVVDVSYRYSDRIGINGRFMHGLNHIGIYQRAGRREFKYELVQFCIALGF